MSVVIHLDEVIVHDDLGDLGKVVASHPRINKYINKYGEMLKARSSPRIAVRDNLGVNWLGRTHWYASEPDISLIVIQRRALADERSLERVVAHEMIHHINFTNDPEWTLAMVRQKRFEGHGREFMRLAEEVNAEMGEGFVTEKSDESYTFAQEGKPYILMIMPRGEARGFSYAWAARMTPKTDQFFAFASRRTGAVLVRMTNPHWANKGLRIGDRRGVAVPQNAEDQAELARLYAGVMEQRAREN